MSPIEGCLSNNFVKHSEKVADLRLKQRNLENKVNGSTPKHGATGFLRLGSSAGHLTVLSRSVMTFTESVFFKHT